MLSGINFNHLYYFYIIAKEGSLIEAAKKLNVSQPTLSQQLKQFEEKLGHSLFSRNGRSLKINSHGRYIFEHSQELFTIAEKMMSGLSYKQNMNTDKYCSIGLTPTISRSYAVKLLEPLFINSEVCIKSTENNLEELIESLYSQDIDFILTEMPKAHLIGKGIISVEIKKPLQYLVCGNNFSKRDSKLNFPEDFNDLPYFKYSTESQIQKEVDKVFYTNNVIPNVVGESDDLRIMIEATKLSNCFSIVPDVSVKCELESGTLKKLASFESSSVSICAIFLSEIDNKKTISLIDSIKKQFDGK